MRDLLLALVRAYRIALAPFFGPSCRFVPSCSVYAEEAIQVFGWRRGTWMATRRICRCHPFSRRGADPVPPAPGLPEARPSGRPHSHVAIEGRA